MDSVGSSIPSPDAHVPVPAALDAIAAGRRLVPVWVNAIGGTTFRVGGSGGADTAEEYLKWVPRRYAGWITAEADRLAWAGRWLRVPEVLDRGADDDGAWLRTRAVRGWSAVDPRWRDEPRTAVVGIAEGLRAMHDTLPVADCPFAWSDDSRLRRARAAGVDVDVIGPAPTPDLAVVCHGDACSPNTLLGADGRWVGHVDLGALGVADRWADIAVATMALGWNYGPGWDGVFLDAYGVEPDEGRTSWYRALWNLDVDEV
ncbi:MULTISPECIES: phosphotransferase [unclassified Curtobacterium]|uniref:phosphotransferase n=1 Tax=unclassified Curtobacterium TaxID=257496 RepID=UPI003807CB81